MADAETTTHDFVRFADCETQTGEWRRDLRDLAALASGIDSAWEAVPLEPDFFVLMPMVDGHVVATVGAPLHFDQYRDLNPLLAQACESAFQRRPVYAPVVPVDISALCSGISSAGRMVEAVFSGVIDASRQNLTAYVESHSFSDDALADFVGSKRRRAAAGGRDDDAQQGTRPPQSRYVGPAFVADELPGQVRKILRHHKVIAFVYFPRARSLRSGVSMDYNARVQQELETRIFSLTTYHRPTRTVYCEPKLHGGSGYTVEDKSVFFHLIRMTGDGGGNSEDDDNDADFALSLDSRRRLEATFFPLAPFVEVITGRLDNNRARRPGEEDRSFVALLLADDPTVAAHATTLEAT